MPPANLLSKCRKSEYLMNTQQVDGPKAAAAYFEKAFFIEEKHLGPKDIRLSHTLRQLGFCTRKVSKYAKYVFPKVPRVFGIGF